MTRRKAPDVLGILLTVAATAAHTSPEDVARRHVHQAEQLASGGRWREALVELEAAWSAKPHPELLFDFGKCHEALGEAAEAIRYYRGYLDAVPQAGDREVVQQSIHELETALRSRAEPVPEGAAHAPLTAARGGRSLLAGTFAASGVSLASFVVGLTFGSSAQSGRRVLVSDVYSQAEVQRIHDAVAARALGANIAYGVAGAAAVLALVLLVLDLKADR